MIKTATFIKSSNSTANCPPPNKPEYAFVGRSNVGKSSLINMITGYKNLAKTSSLPGKTQLINHFLINDEWYLTDLPGYGYAKISKKDRNKLTTIINDYLIKRENLMTLFLLIDSRHKPLRIDLEFLHFLGSNKISFVICFTKSDKLKASGLQKNIQHYQDILKETWEPLPRMIITSSKNKMGRKEILFYVKKTNDLFQ